MNEKENIELTTARAFLKQYNLRKGSSYEIIEHSDAPDVPCRDRDDRKLNLEITLTQDREDDIKALLGRSDARIMDTSKPLPVERVSCLQDDVCPRVANAIKKKLGNDYGRNTALVVCHASLDHWSWDTVRRDLAASLDLSHNPFDKGIWIIRLVDYEIFQVV